MSRAIGLDGVPIVRLVEDLEPLKTSVTGSAKPRAAGNCGLCSHAWRPTPATLCVVYRNGASIEVCQGCWDHRVAASTKLKAINVIKLTKE